MGSNVDAHQSYVAGILTELTAAWYLAHSIEGEKFQPVVSELIEHFRQPRSILKGFESDDNFAQLEHSMTLVGMDEPQALHDYVAEGVQMGQYLVEHALSDQGLGTTSLTDIVSIEWAAEDDSSQADLIVRYRDAAGELRNAEYSAKAGASPPAAQSRGLGAYRLTVSQCRTFYMKGIQTWLTNHSILYPTIDQNGYEIAVKGCILQGPMDLNNHRSSDGGLDLESVPLDFYQCYEEWNAVGNHAMCDALLHQMSTSVNGMCLAYALIKNYLELAEQSGAVLYVLQADAPPSLQSQLLRACVQIRSEAQKGLLAGEIRRKSNTATWTICDTSGRAVLGIMMRNAFGRGPKPGTGRTHSVPKRVKIQMTLAGGEAYDGELLARFTKSVCTYTV